jgi:hypothetical protein
MAELKKILHNTKLGGNNSWDLKREINYETIRQACLIDLTAEVEKPPTAIEIHTGDIVAPAFTLGNFSMLTGKAKSKKTFLLTAIAASAITGIRQLGTVQGVLPEEKRKVLFFDTESSLYHASRMAKRICQQAGIDNPDNLEYYSLRKYKPDERVKIIEHILYNTDGVGIVFLDGGRDLLTLGINNEEQATQTTSDFLRWTTELNFHLCMVLHQNKNDLNPRGHFGTECQNKAETVLSVEKSSDVDSITIVKPDFTRDIEFLPFAFFINERGIPEACEIPEGSTQQMKTTNPIHIADEKHFEVLEGIYRQIPQSRFTEIRDAIICGFNYSFGETNCRKFISYYLNKKWIIKERNGKNVFYKYNRALF